MNIIMESKEKKPDFFQKKEKRDYFQSPQRHLTSNLLLTNSLCDSSQSMCARTYKYTHKHVFIHTYTYVCISREKDNELMTLKFFSYKIILKLMIRFI